MNIQIHTAFFITSDSGCYLENITIFKNIVLWVLIEDSEEE